MAIREIHSLIDSHPVVNEHQLKLWEWISFIISLLLEMFIKPLSPPRL